MRRLGGFTLLELVVVVVIAGVIAAIATVRAQSVVTRSRYNSALATFNAFEQAAGLYRADFGVYPPDTISGSPLTPFQGYMQQVPSGTEKTPLSGRWDWNNQAAAYWASIGTNISVHFPTGTVPTADLTAFDAAHDNGNLTTGRFTRWSRFLMSKLPE
jgi:prepilin-type N-terminal cleavage/methylation domain-containing protein